MHFETFVREGFLNGKRVVSIFLDLDEAYDTTWKYRVMKDLYGMDFGLPLFIQNLFILKKISSQIRDTPL